MDNNNVAPFTGQDGQTAPSYSALIGGKTAGGVQQDMLVSNEGKPQVEFAAGSQVAASAETNTVFDGTTALTPKYAIIAASSSGNTQVVAAVTSKKIRVLGYNYMANGTVNVKFQSASTDKTGLGYLIANTGKVCPFSPVGWFETVAGEALNINLSGNVAVGGELAYVEV